MLQHHELSNAGLSICHGTSAHETGAPSILNTNSLRFYTPQGSRHRRPSDTGTLRDALRDELLRLHSDIRRIRLRDTGTLFLITLYLQGGKRIRRSAYNLRNLRALAIEALA